MHREAELPSSGLQKRQTSHWASHGMLPSTPKHCQTKCHRILCLKHELSGWELLVLLVMQIIIFFAQIFPYASPALALALKYL